MARAERAKHGDFTDLFSPATAGDVEANERHMKGRRIHGGQLCLAGNLPDRPLQVLEAGSGVVSQQSRAIKQFDTGTQGNIQYIALRRVGLRYFLHVEVEQ